jgi:hypothetical protein
MLIKERWARGRKAERCASSHTGRHRRELGEYSCCECGRRLCNCPRYAERHTCSLVPVVTREWE